MNQALYAHMNNKRKMKKNSLLGHALMWLCSGHSLAKSLEKSSFKEMGRNFCFGNKSYSQFKNKLTF
jgi:hypothetical protein